MWLRAVVKRNLRNSWSRSLVVTLDDFIRERLFVWFVYLVYLSTDCMGIIECLGCFGQQRQQVVAQAFDPCFGSEEIKWTSETMAYGASRSITKSQVARRKALPAINSEQPPTKERRTTPFMTLFPNHSTKNQSNITISSYTTFSLRIIDSAILYIITTYFLLLLNILKIYIKEITIYWAQSKILTLTCKVYSKTWVAARLRSVTSEKNQSQKIFFLER